MPPIATDYIVFSLLAVTVFSVYMATVTLMRKDPVRERLKRVLPPEAQEEAGATRGPLYRFCYNVLTLFSFNVAGARKEMFLPLARADMLSEVSATYFFFFRKVIQPIFLLLSAIVALQLLWLENPGLADQLSVLLTAILLGVIGVRGSDLYLHNRTQKRKKILQHSFPDALDLLLVCVEAGLPLDGALTRVCRELKRAHPVIAMELDRTRIELNVLNDRAQALENLAERTDTQGFRTLASTLIQTEKVGNSIADMLRTLADEFRISRMLYAENKAARIPALITIPLIFFIMPAFMLIIIGPPIVKVQQQGGFFPTAQSNTR